MKNKRALIFIAALLAVTALCAFRHLTTRTEVALGTIIVSVGGSDRTIAFDNLTLHSVEGEIVNGKGETTPVNAVGVHLADALRNAQVDVGKLTALTIMASDEYRAVLTGDEVRDSDKAWLIFQEDGGLQLIVFGDPNSKRNVSDAVRMEVQ